MSKKYFEFPAYNASMLKAARKYLYNFQTLEGFMYSPKSEGKHFDIGSLIHDVMDRGIEALNTFVVLPEEILENLTSPSEKKVIMEKDLFNTYLDVYNNKDVKLVLEQRKLFGNDVFNWTESGRKALAACRKAVDKIESTHATIINTLSNKGFYEIPDAVIVTDPTIKKFIDLAPTIREKLLNVIKQPNYELFGTEVEIYGKYLDYPIKVMCDRIEVSHVDRKIRIIDWKTTSSTFIGLASDYKKYGYDLQASFYKENLHNHPELRDLILNKGYVIDFLFVFINTSNYLIKVVSPEYSDYESSKLGKIELPRPLLNLRVKPNTIQVFVNKETRQILNNKDIYWLEGVNGMHYYPGWDSVLKLLVKFNIAP